MAKTNNPINPGHSHFADAAAHEAVRFGLVSGGICGNEKAAGTRAGGGQTDGHLGVRLLFVRMPVRPKTVSGTNGERPDGGSVEERSGLVADSNGDTARSDHAVAALSGEGTVAPVEQHG